MARAGRSGVDATSGAAWLGVAALACGGGLLSCAGALGEPAPELEESALGDASGSLVIAKLNTRHGRVAITSAAGEVRYSLLDAPNGGEGLTLEQLRSRDPALFELLERATAGGAAPRTAPVLDARLDAVLRAAPIEAGRAVPGLSRAP